MDRRGKRPFGPIAARPPAADQLVEPAIKLPNDVAELTRALIRVQIGAQVGLRIQARELIELPPHLGETASDLGDVLGIGMARQRGSVAARAVIGRTRAFAVRATTD